MRAPVSGSTWFKWALMGVTCLALTAPVGAYASTELTVYTAYENDDLKAYKATFEKDNPDITINWVRDSSAALASL